MTRRTRTSRSVEDRLDALESSSDSSEGGFWIISVGGDPDEGGRYTWDDRREAYTNDSGHEVPPEEAPSGDSEFNYEVDSKNSNSEVDP